MFFVVTVFYKDRTRVRISFGSRTEASTWAQSQSVKPGVLCVEVL